MRGDSRHFGHLLGQELLDIRQVGYAGRDEVALPAAIMFAQQGLAEHHRVPGHNVVRTASRSTGGVWMTLSSRRPDIAICSVRGIGVAVSVSTCTSARRFFSRSL
jgi:hypothetical protein